MIRAMLLHTPRPSGFVTQALINEHGSFRAALAVLNAQAMSAGTAKTPKAVEGDSPPARSRQGCAQTPSQTPSQNPSQSGPKQ